MNGWSYADVRALPADVYDEVINLLNDEAAQK